MADVRTEDIVLLPIQPKYVELICSGCKQVEFRKRRFKRNISHIVIYATSPIKQVIGCFKVQRIQEGTPDEIWQKYRLVSCSEEESYHKYYSGKSLAVAIEIDDLHILNRPVSLDFLSKDLKPPQSYYYLPNELFEKLVKL